MSDFRPGFFHHAYLYTPPPPSVRYRLPFPDGKFDLVRMANLSLCIPYDRWEFILMEVHRVLTRHGRLEFIDDQIFYPYGNPPSRPSSTSSSSSSKHSSFDEDFFDSDGSDEGIDLDLCPRPRHAFPDPLPHRQTLTRRSKHLETVFEKMLEQRYRIHPRPHLFILHLLENIFGTDSVRKFPNKHLLLAPSEQPPFDGHKDADRTSLKSTDSGFASGSSSSSLHRKKSWYPLSREKEKRADKLDISDSSLREEACLEANRRKAALVLGLEPRSGKPSQSPGLVLYPSTYIPIAPLELEMHACKHMHVLMGCRSALGDYVAQFKDEKGLPLVDERGFRDFMWDYERFVPLSIPHQVVG